MAIKIKTPEQVELIRLSAKLLGEALTEVAKEVKVGGNGLVLDKLAETYIRDNGGVPSFKGLYGCPSSILISVNEMRKIKEELYDIISEHSGQPLDKVAKDSDRDYWMRAQEAKDYGMIDEVLIRNNKKD